MSTKKTLDPADFMMMDVHRPMTDDEISEVAPQAVVDKTLKLVGTDVPYLNVVPIAEGPSLQDIAGQLRALADRIEGGEYGEVDTMFAVMPVLGGYPKLWGWGDIDGQFDPIIQLELMKQWLLNNITAR